MAKISELIWDEWNQEHIKKHGISIEEVEKVCHSRHITNETYRGRIEVEGKTESGKVIKVILSLQDRNLKVYGSGIYYPITAFEKGVKKYEKKN